MAIRFNWGAAGADWSTVGFAVGGEVTAAPVGSKGQLPIPDLYTTPRGSRSHRDREQSQAGRRQAEGSGVCVVAGAADATGKNTCDSSLPHTQ